MIIRRIISGGQTGADRGGLDAAVALDIEHGGFCPRGRRAEDGIIPSIYRLVELDDPGYPARTWANVEASDATVIITAGPRMTPGSASTMRCARGLDRPAIHVPLPPARPSPATISRLVAWLGRVRPETLNVASSGGSKAPGLQARTSRLIACAICLATIPGLLIW